MSFPANIDLFELDGTNGFRVRSFVDDHHVGRSVASAGDVNGDGFADLIVGAVSTGTFSATSYVVFGAATGFDFYFDLSGLTGTNGFEMADETVTDDIAIWVASAGDVNGDGFADLIVGAPNTQTVVGTVGDSYVVFGKASGFVADFDRSSLNGSNGFLMGGMIDDSSGWSVASAGDVNGDGFADVIVGAPKANHAAGETYVVFGKASGFDAVYVLHSLNASDGFHMPGHSPDDGSGWSVASAGDMNGDGLMDMIVGARNLAVSYVVFGATAGFGGFVDLSSLDGQNGFRLLGSGFSVASAGDVNGDGFDDLIIGSPPGDLDYYGASYVVLGKASGFAARLDLASLDGSNGFRLASSDAGKSGIGWSVSSAGDVNGDGFADLIIGEPNADTLGSGSHEHTGGAYVMFGGAFGGSTAPVTKTGTAPGQNLIGGAGRDTLIGLGGADVLRGGAGDDMLRVGDLAFLLADGGGGTDTLVLAGADLTLDLTGGGPSARRIKGIERIDLTGSGNNTLVIDRHGVLVGPGAIIDGTHVLTILGTAGDRVLLGDEKWDFAGSITISGETFDRYVLGNGEVDIEQGVSAPGTTIEGTVDADTINQTTTVVGQPLTTNRNDAIYGDDGNDRIDGADGNDTIEAGPGDDIVTGGGGSDDIHLGSGRDTVRDALAALNDDRISGFGSDDMLDILGVQIGRAALGVVKGAHGVTIVAGGSSFELVGDFSKGDFMTVARGTGLNAHTMVTFDPFLPSLSEGVRVDPASINGIINEPFLTGDGAVRFSLELKSAVSAFSNALGTYKIAADGTIHDVHVLFANTLDVQAGAHTVDLGVPPDGESIGFFLIQNGFNAYGSLPDDLSFVSPGTAAPAAVDSGVPAVLYSATRGALEGAAIFHSIAKLNPADADHVLSGVAPGGRELLLGFEDLPAATGDNDFQDVVVGIRAFPDDV